MSDLTCEAMTALEHELAALAEARGFKVGWLEAQYHIQHHEWWIALTVPGTHAYGLLRLPGSLTPGEAVLAAAERKADMLDEIEKALGRTRTA